MFRQLGTARSDRQNRLLAGYLAFVGGYVNSVGFLLVGSFTSHVTGNIGRAANDLAGAQFGAAVAALTMTLAFCAGAFLSSVMVESTFFGKTSRAYAVALAGEGALLIAFMIFSSASFQTHPRVRDAEALLLCAAMGMQNSLVTRLSGAVVRTTHLTGVFTDIGIEAARWFRFWRGQASERLGVPIVFGKNVVERPHAPKIVLLATIAGAFAIGATMGAIAVVRLHHSAMAFAVVAVLGCSFYAALNSRDTRGPDDVRPSRR
ncbi:putative transmembrane protein [Labilithrix luteola]|uniref:Putative transmembrane protein n=1 Tax=Labilithrix luteola TaxID=1391654 RepID=A0A0K1Q1Q8_9BACT|nr:YoaK family protein [Labilithrix luteola]AKU99324.1 putative transmembrane protein [Labilithrix luteola]